METDAKTKFKNFSRYVRWGGFVCRRRAFGCARI